MRRLRTSLALLLTAGLLAPAAALAGPSEDFTAVYKSYQAKGVVDGCAFSAAKLASARKGVPPDIDTYAPDFPDALDAALRRRAAGDCDKKAAPARKAAGASEAAAAPAAPAASDPGAGGPAAEAVPGTAATGASGAPGTSTTPAPAPEATAAPAAADGSVATAAERTASSTSADDAPFPLVLLAVLLGLALLLGFVWAVLRFFAVDPPWLVTGRHATAEAGWRASASWAEFTDWVRLGR